MICKSSTQELSLQSHTIKHIAVHVRAHHLTSRQQWLPFGLLQKPEGTMIDGMSDNRTVDNPLP